MSVVLAELDKELQAKGFIKTVSDGRRDYASTVESYCKYVLRFSVIYDYSGDGLYTVLGSVSSNGRPVYVKNAVVPLANLEKAINKIKDGMFKIYAKCLEIDKRKFG